jgi:pyruvate,water dikinase
MSSITSSEPAASPLPPAAAASDAYRLAAFTQGLFDCRDTLHVGGKAVNLGRLARAGFLVPSGFAVTTSAYRFAQARSAEAVDRLDASSSSVVPTELPDDVADAVRQAYRAMGGGTVAVRSSATAEDMAAASMAGQYETFLDIEGEDDLLDAVRRCWASLDTPRTQAYLEEHGIDPARVAMAVVVQRLVSADVAGVLFTANPNQGGGREMLVEASWGLGESVVSGNVQPDVLRLDQETGRVLGATIADKRVELVAGSHEQREVEEHRRHQPCLRARDVHGLWQLGLRVAEHFGAPQDIEWALHAGELYLLQSRPITTRQEAEAYEEALRTARQHLRDESAAGRGPWVLHNLAETLPHPTPLTWSVIGRFMSGAGGFGSMYRQAGFDPAPLVDREGFLERIGGRVYMDASRAPEMFFENFPFAYDLEELKRTPDASQSPPTLPRGSLLARMKVGRRLAAVQRTLAGLAHDLDRRLRDEVFPDITRYVAQAKATDLSLISDERLIELWQEHERRVMDAFAPLSLLPSLISGMALQELRSHLQEHFWDEDADALSQLISSGGPPNRTVTADAELHEVAQCGRSLETWLKDHGHRAVGEFDLAAPRWRERPEAVREMAARLAGGENPLDRHYQNFEAVGGRVAVLRSQLENNDIGEFDRRVERVRRYVAFREDGKDFLMLGYDLLRDLALEAGRRLEVGEDVFFLTREDLFDALRVGFAPLHLIEQRKSAYRAEAHLTLPHVIDAQNLESLGEETESAAEDGNGHKAFAVSAGQATGLARILRSPTGAPDLGRGYILVCPSTDPSWTPLFVNAAGLVLECGGTLSHGAVVAREMGLPAVVLPNATRLFSEGQAIRVDGRRGWVAAASEPDASETPGAASTASAPHATETAGPASADIDSDDQRIAPAMIPPPPGRQDRAAGRLRNVLAAVWAVYLVAFFLLPARWAHRPTMAVLDTLLWPIVSIAGKRAAVAIIAVIVALATLLLQKFATDNRRLLEAKRRAAALRAAADRLPAHSARRAAVMRLVAPVQTRTFMAALVPIGILLGPMVASFVWLKDRMDPTAWNAPAGSPVRVVATVDSSWSDPVRIDVPASMVVDETTPASRTLPPIRKTLQRLLALYRQPTAARPDEPWEMTLAPDLGREMTANDLQAYLDAGVPPQAITWLVRPPPSFDGRFKVSVAAAGHQPVQASVVLGDHEPPAPPMIEGDSPIKQVRIVYAKSAQEPVFWRPLGWFASRGEHNRFLSRWAAADAGWIGLYVLAYLPTLFIARALLRIA